MCARAWQIHEPALILSKELIQGPGKGWASRVFFSDDGSTAVEVALKMAFRKYMKDHDLCMSHETCMHMHFLPLQNAYA